MHACIFALPPSLPFPSLIPPKHGLKAKRRKESHPKKRQMSQHPQKAIGQMSFDGVPPDKLLLFKLCIFDHFPFSLFTQTKDKDKVKGGF